MKIIQPNYKVISPEFEELERAELEPIPVPLSAEEVRVLLKDNPTSYPWQILIWQTLVGCLVALAAWGLAGSSVAGWSAGYGALAVVLPAALFIRGLARQKNVANASSALLGFFVWEMIKVALTIAMLVAAPKLIVQLNWLAMLAGFVVTMKVYWVAMWLRPMQKVLSKKI